MQLSISLLTILCFATPQVSSGICVNDIEHLLIKERKVAVADIMWEAKTADAVHCAQTCIRLKNCTAFGFDRNASLCQLTSSSGPPSKAGVHSVFSDIGGWPSQTDPNCYNRPCGKDEVCIPGDTGDGDTCSYSCFRMDRCCPAIPGARPINHSRGVGSIYNHTCSHGYVGYDSATCLPTGKWTKALKMDEICTPLYEGTCNDDTHCSPINGVCVDNRCSCAGGLVFAASISRCVKECDQDWVQYDRYCYIFVETVSTFQGGFEFCAELNSSLLYVESVEENEFIKKHLLRGRFNDRVMIGLRGANHKETWWTMKGNKTATYWDWSPGEPNDNFTAEECTVYLPGFLMYHWADMPCSHAFKFICKKETELPI